jgi:hypothetical protein
MSAEVMELGKIVFVPNETVRSSDREVAQSQAVYPHEPRSTILGTIPARTVLGGRQ